MFRTFGYLAKLVRHLAGPLDEAGKQQALKKLR